MASPDVSGYVDLRLYDRTPADLLEVALADISSKFPGFAPRAGSVERVLLEALALLAAEQVYAINRLPSAIAVVLLRLFGADRSEGSPPTTTVTFNLVDDLGHTIPAGTRISLSSGSDGESLIFTTDVELVVDPGDTSGTVAATAGIPTDEANNTPSGTAVALLDSVTSVETAELASAVVGGAPPESDAEWLDRGRARLLRLSDALVLARHFTEFALEHPEVTRATTIDLWNADTAATDTGHVTVAVAGPAGALLDASDKDDLEAEMENAAVAGLTVHVVDPTITDVDVEVTVKRLDGYSNAEVAAAVTDALADYLSPDTWAWGDTVRRNELIALIDRTAGVDYVETLTVPALDLTLTGIAPLARLGTPTVTVNAP